MAVSDNVSKFRLVSVENEQHVTDPAGPDLAGAGLAGLKFQYKVEVIINIPQNMVHVVPYVKFRSGDKSLLETCAVFNFSIADIRSLVSLDKADKSIRVSDGEALPGIVGVAFDSMRGVAYMHTKDTALAGFPVPMVDRATLMEQCEISVIEP